MNRREWLTAGLGGLFGKKKSPAIKPGMTLEQQVNVLVVVLEAHSIKLEGIEKRLKGDWTLQKEMKREEI